MSFLLGLKRYNSKAFYGFYAMLKRADKINNRYARACIEVNKELSVMHSYISLCRADECVTHVH